MIKTINVILFLLLFIGILAVTVQKGEYLHHRLQVYKAGGYSLSYNTISIKEIDSLSSYMNIRFSKLLTERIKFH